MALKSLVIAFGAVLVAAAPAAAGTNSKAEKVNASEGTGASSKAAQQTKYCIKETDTGTHLESKECRTKAQWAQEGIDIEQFAKKK
jgi:hypothetical protein